MSIEQILDGLEEQIDQRLEEQREAGEPNIFLSERTMRLVWDWCAWPWQEDTTVDDVVFMAMSLLDMASLREKWWRDHFERREVEFDPEAIMHIVATER